MQARTPREPLRTEGVGPVPHADASSAAGEAARERAPTQRCSERAASRPSMTENDESVTHVSGINRNPCVRNGPVSGGALGGIRTPDPQIRSLVLYPAEL